MMIKSSSLRFLRSFCSLAIRSRTMGQTSSSTSMSFTLDRLGSPMACNNGPVWRSFHSSVGCLAKDKGGKGGGGGGKESKKKQSKEHHPPKKGGGGGGEPDVLVADDGVLNLQSYEEKMKAAVEEYAEYLGRMVLSSRTPQGQLQAMLVTVNGKKAYLTELGWPTTNPANDIYHVTVTAPSQAEAKEAYASLKQTYPELDASLTKASITLSFRMITQEVREQIVADVKKMTESHRINVRKAHNSAVKALDKMKLTSAKEQQQWKSKIKGLHDVYIKQIDTMMKDRSKQIMAP